MNTSIAQALPVLALIAGFIALVLGVVWVHNSIPEDKKERRVGFAIVAFLILAFLGYIVLKNGEPSSTSHSKLPPPPTAHELAMHKELAADREDTRIRQKAFLDSQAAQLAAEREHAAKQKEQELKAQKRKSKTDTLERLTKIGEGQLKLLEKISKQAAPVVNVTNHFTGGNVSVHATSAPPAITLNVPATTNFFQVQAPKVDIVNSNYAPVTVMVPTVPVTLTLSSTATVSSGSTTQAVAKLPLLPAPPVTPAPPAPQAPVKVKAPKAPVTPAVVPTNAASAKASVAKAPAAKVGRAVVTHTEDPGKLSRGAKGWFGDWFGLTSGSAVVIQRKFTLEYNRGNAEDQALAQKALDLFIAHQAKELRKEATPKNLLGMFTEFVNKNTGLKLGAVLGMNPVITSEILPAATSGT